MRRLTDDLLGPDEYRAAGTRRDPFATYRATCDLVFLGADMSGRDPRIDRALFARVLSARISGQGLMRVAASESRSQLQELFTAVTATKG